MPRNITDAQKRVQDFHKSDALAQTNQIKYDYCFMHGIENIKKLFSQDLKLELKDAGTFFQILYCSLILQWKKKKSKSKKVIWSSWGALERDFSKPRIS